MAEVLDTYIKSPSPPKDPDAQYVYNEQQFGKLENALRKHHDKILDTSANATALYESEVIARSEADSAIVQTVETLRATVEGNNTTTQGQIQNIQTAQADAESSTASKFTALEAKVDSGDAQNLALIQDEAKTRATKVDSLASKVSALESSVKVAQSESRALVKQETQARATAVSAESSARTSLQSYVGWNGGSYTADLTTTMNTKVSKTDGASYAWAVQGTIDGVTGGLRLTGAKRLNPTTGATETTTNLIIDANTTINGDLLVSGTVTGAKIGTGSSGIATDNIINNAVSNSWYQAGSNGSVGITVPVTAGSRYVIFAMYTGGHASSVAGTHYLNIYYAYPPSADVLVQSLPVYLVGAGLALNVSYGYTSSTGSFVNGIGGTLNYILPSAVAIGSFTAPSSGSCVMIGRCLISGSYSAQPVNIYIVELKK